MLINLLQQKLINQLKLQKQIVEAKFGDNRPKFNNQNFEKWPMRFTRNVHFIIF